MSEIVGLDGKPVEQEAPGDLPAAEKPEVPPEDVDFDIRGTADDVWVDVIQADKSPSGKQEVFLCWGTVAHMAPTSAVQQSGPQAVLKVPLTEKGRRSMTDLRAEANRMWRNSEAERQHKVNQMAVMQARAIAAAQEAQKLRQRQLQGRRR
jgi:hypothetical protein